MNLDLTMHRLECAVLLAYDESLRRLGKLYPEFGIQPCLSDEQRERLGEYVLDPVADGAVR